MGIDVNSLDAQVQQNREAAQKIVDDERTERLRQMEIDRIIEESNREEKAMKDYLNSEVKADWERAMEYKAAALAAEDNGFDINKCTVSAAQSFAGDDPFRKDRIRAQKGQMRSWVFEQMAEKKIMADEQGAEEKAYADMMVAVGEIRDAADKEEKDMGKYLNATVHAENLSLGSIRQQKFAEEKKWSKEKAATSVDLMDNQDIAMDENGRIIRKDMFRGYNAAQIRRIIQENEDLLAYRRQVEDNADGDDRAWRKQSLIQQQAMEVANHNEQELRKNENQRNLAVIREQMAAQRQRLAFGKKDKFGAVEPGFFDKFGAGCR